MACALAAIEGDWAIAKSGYDSKRAIEKNINVVFLMSYRLCELLRIRAQILILHAVAKVQSGYTRQVRLVWIITALPMIDRLTADPGVMTGAGDVAAAFIEVHAEQPDPHASRLKSTQRQSARTRRFFLGELAFRHTLCECPWIILNGNSPQPVGWFFALGLTGVET